MILLVGKVRWQLTSPNTNLESKRRLNYQSGRENDGSTTPKHFKIMSEEKKYRQSLPSDMGDYTNENTEKFIPDKALREAILLKLSIHDNLDPVKKLDDFLAELLKQMKKIQTLSKLWVMIGNVKTANDGNAPVIQMDMVLELLEKTVVLVG